MPFPHSSNNEVSYLSDPDVILMLEFQKGDKASFEKLMERNYKRIFNFIYRFVGQEETAEDLAQEVFIKIYKNAASYRPQAKFQTWACQIAKNLSLNELRRLKKPDVSLDETFETGEGQVTRQIPDERTPTPYQSITEKEKADIIKEAVESLPDNQRMAVILRRYENMSYEDIAKSLGCSLEAVKSLLNRAKENLKEKLSGLESP